MLADALIPSKYIRAADFGATLPQFPTFTIREAVIEKVPSLKPGAREGDEEKKGALYFTDEPDGRGWVMNKTNVACLKAMFGDDTDGWIGKRVTLMSAPVKVGPKTEPGVRIKGSPDLTSEVKAVVKLPKRKPETFNLVPTGRSGSGNGKKPSEWDLFSRAACDELGLNPAALLEWARSEKQIDPATVGPDILRPLYGSLDGGPDRESYDAFVKRSQEGAAE